MSEPITNLTDAVAALGALPMPAGPEPVGPQASVEQLNFLHRVTLPDLRREVEHQKDGKARWRARAEKAEARVAELEAERAADHRTWQHDLRTARGEREATSAQIAGLEKRLHDAAMTRVWKNEDGKKFVFVEDIAPALLGEEPKPDAITRTFAAVQGLREDDVSRPVAKLQALPAGQREAVDGEHYAAVHHSYRTPRDLPESGGAQ